MPMYEYRNEETGEIRTELKPISECAEDLVIDGVTWKRILSPTPTTFRFNDNTGFKGLDKKRRNW